MIGESDILKIEGIVVRLIPRLSVSRWGYREGDEKRLKSGEEIVKENGRKFLKRTEENTMAGYAVTFSEDQGSIVRFSREVDGFGDTIVEAYQDFIKKNRAVK